jgi:ABC-type antimicrobial peptide transport system permease subunit
MIDSILQDACIFGVLSEALARRTREIGVRLAFQVSSRDLGTFGGMSALMVAVALLACWMPARRAARVDPIAALRCE